MLQRAGRGARRSATGMIVRLIIARRGENVKMPGEKISAPQCRGRTGINSLRRSVLRLPGRSGGLHADSGTAPFPHGLLRNRSGRRVDHKAMWALWHDVPPGTAGSCFTACQKGAYHLRRSCLTVDWRGRLCDFLDKWRWLFSIRLSLDRQYSYNLQTPEVSDGSNMTHFSVDTGFAASYVADRRNRKGYL